MPPPGPTSAPSTRATAPAAPVLSAAEWCYWRNRADPAAVYAQLREAGYSSVEMVPKPHRQAARKAGLTLLNIAAPGMATGINHKSHHPALLPQLRDAIRDAGDDGIPQVIVFSGSRQGLPDAVGIANCAAALSELIPFAEDRNVVLILEILNNIDHRDYHACSSAFAFEVAHRVNHPHLKILADLYHLARMNEDLEKATLPNLPHIAHFHLAATPTRGLPTLETRPDYPSLYRKLTAAGYRACWGMEFTVPKDQDPLAQYAQAAAFARTWQA